MKLYKTEKYIHFWAECCRKYALPQKKLQIKVFPPRISDKKVHESIVTFRASGSTAMGDRHMPLWTFLSKIQCRKTLIWSFFGYNAYLWQRSAQSECIFTLVYNFIFKPYHLSSQLAPLQGEIHLCPRGLFCPKFVVKNFYLKLFFWDNAYFRQRSAQKWIIIVFYIKKKQSYPVFIRDISANIASHIGEYTNLQRQSRLALGYRMFKCVPKLTVNASLKTSARGKPSLFAAVCCAVYTSVQR